MKRLDPLTGLAMVGNPITTTTAAGTTHNRALMVAAGAAAPHNTWTTLPPAAIPSYVHTHTVASAAATAPKEEDDDDDDDDSGPFIPYYNRIRSGWRPLTKDGTAQRTPNMIRGELQRYLDTCGQTQTSVLQRLGVNPLSFRKFMNPRNYKNPWNAIQNKTYWAAAKFLEEYRNNRPKETIRKSRKRKANDNDDDDDLPEQEVDQKSRRELTKKLMKTIHDHVQLPYPQDAIIYDSCPELVKKIKTFLDNNAVTKAEFCRTGLEGVNSNSLTQFLLGKDQDQQANVTYRRAWIFFEKFRLFFKLPKSPRRLQNEIEYPQGFPTHRPRRMVRADPLGRDRYYNPFLLRL